MEPLRKHPRSLGLTMILVLSAWGCAHAPNPEVPGTWRITFAAPSWRQALRPGATVGVRAAGGEVLNLIGAQPVTREQGADKGARAVGFTVLSAARTMGPPNEVTVPSYAATLVGHFVVAPTAFIMWGPATLAGVGVGALSTPSATSVAAAEATLTRAWEKSQASATLQRHLVAAAQEGPGPRLLPLPASTLAPAGDHSSQVGGDKAAETILAVFGPKVHLSSTEGVEQPNPRLALVLAVHIQLLRRTDGSVLYDARVTKESAAAYPFTAWAANDAQPLREEIDRASASLATQIMGELFGTETF